MQSPTAIEIPNKSHFKVNEVCNITGVKPYVLRYWETEFEQIAPKTNSSGQKMYEQKDIEAVLSVKVLLFDQKMTIEKAKMEMDRSYGIPSPIVASDEFKAADFVEVKKEQAVESTDSLTKTHTSRSLSDRDVQKLVMAKAKLNSVLMLCTEIEQKQNWV